MRFARTGLSSRRWVLAISDQIVSASSNAANLIVAAFLLSDVDAAGQMMLAVTIVYFAVNFIRSFVGDVLLVVMPRSATDHDRQELVRNATTTASAIVLVAIPAMLLLQLTAPAQLNLRYLAWGALVLPAIALQDVGRYVAFSTNSPAKALQIDIIWVAVQAMLVGLLTITGRVTAATLILAWGAGALIGAIVWLAAHRLNPLRGSPMSWLSVSKGLSGWFSATSVIGQIQVQILAMGISGVGGPSAFAQFRLAQVAILAPAQNAGMAAMSVLTPRSSRLSERCDVDAIRTQTRQSIIAISLVAVPALALLCVLARPLLRAYLPSYLPAAALAIPMAIYAYLYVIQAPYNSAFRGMLSGERVFGYGLASSLFAVGGFSIGIWFGGVVGACWGLASALALSTLLAHLIHRRSVVRLGSPTELLRKSSP